MKIKPSTRYRLDLDTRLAADFDYFEVVTNADGDLAKVEAAPGQDWAWKGRLLAVSSLVVGELPTFVDQDQARLHLNYPITAIAAI